MDILRISKDSLKVMLTSEDMATYSIDYDVLSNDTSLSVDIIRHILRDAGEKCGFSSEGEKLFVQIYASHKGECEIFVKRLENTLVSALDIREKTKEIRLAAVSQSRGLFVYSFCEMNPMIHTCKRLQTAKYFGNSAAYKENGMGVYYLILEERSPLPEEHGGHLCSKNTAYYINEHCSLICHDAVKALGDLA